MTDREVTRRNFIYGSAAGTAVALMDPPGAAAATVGVKRGDLPDLTIKEVKIYVTSMDGIHRLNGTETGQLVSIVTEGGLEGVYSLGDRNPTAGWLEWAKPALVGKSVIDLLPRITASSGLKGQPGGFGDLKLDRDAMGFWHIPHGAGNHSAFMSAALEGSALQTRGGGTWPNYYTAAAEVCMWDILGKAVNRPVYEILSGGETRKDRLMAYASSNHLPHIEDYAPDVLKAQKLGYRGYKIHPGMGQPRSGRQIPTYVGHMEEIREVRRAVGDDYVLMHDPVQMYNRFEALQVGRLLQDLNYLWLEDPIPENDTEGLIELRKRVDIPLHIGEFLYSIADFAEYIKRDALTCVRPIVDNCGGLSGSVRVGLLGDAHGLECEPHNWGNEFDLIVAFHVELALPNSYWFEMPFPAEYADRPYFKYKFRPDKDGYVPAPTEPGLGYPLDRGALDRMTLRILR